MRTYGSKLHLVFLGTVSLRSDGSVLLSLHFNSWEVCLGTHNISGWVDSEVVDNLGRVSVKVKQRPVKMGGRTTYRTLSPKRAPFQIGID
jgi:hypothetical protein